MNTNPLHPCRISVLALVLMLTALSPVLAEDESQLLRPPPPPAATTPLPPPLLPPPLYQHPSATAELASFASDTSEEEPSSDSSDAEENEQASPPPPPPSVPLPPPPQPSLDFPPPPQPDQDSPPPPQPDQDSPPPPQPALAFPAPPQPDQDSPPPPQPDQDSPPPPQPYQDSPPPPQPALAFPPPPQPDQDYPPPPQPDQDSPPPPHPDQEYPPPPQPALASPPPPQPAVHSPPFQPPLDIPPPLQSDQDSPPPPQPDQDSPPTPQPEIQFPSPSPPSPSPPTPLPPTPSSPLPPSPSPPNPPNPSSSSPPPPSFPLPPPPQPSLDFPPPPHPDQDSPPTPQPAIQFPSPSPPSPSPPFPLPPSPLPPIPLPPTPLSPLPPSPSPPYPPNPSSSPPLAPVPPPPSPPNPASPLPTPPSSSPSTMTPPPLSPSDPSPLSPSPQHPPPIPLLPIPSPQPPEEKPLPPSPLASSPPVPVSPSPPRPPPQSPQPPPPSVPPSTLPEPPLPQPPSLLPSPPAPPSPVPPSPLEERPPPSPHNPLPPSPPVPGSPWPPSPPPWSPQPALHSPPPPLPDQDFPVPPSPDQDFPQPPLPDQDFPTEPQPALDFPAPPQPDQDITPPPSLPIPSAQPPLPPPPGPPLQTTPAGAPSPPAPEPPPPSNVGQSSPQPPTPGTPLPPDLTNNPPPPRLHPPSIPYYPPTSPSPPLPDCPSPLIFPSPLLSPPLPTSPSPSLPVPPPPPTAMHTPASPSLPSPPTLSPPPSAWTSPSPLPSPSLPSPPDSSPHAQSPPPPPMTPTPVPSPRSPLPSPPSPPSPSPPSVIPPRVPSQHLPPPPLPLPPLSPAPPAATLCSCPSAPLSDGTCPSSSKLASVQRTGAGQEDKATEICLPAPASSDPFLKRFTFSLCWRWSCFDETFRLPDPAEPKPYSISIIDIAQGNSEGLRPGQWSQMELRMPPGVDAVVTVCSHSDSGTRSSNSAGDGTKTNELAQEESSYSESGAIMLLDDASLDVRLEVPAARTSGDLTASIQITPLPFPPSPPRPPISPPFPPLAPLAPSVTKKIVTTLTILMEVKSEEGLGLIFDPPSADVKVSLAGYFIQLPISFPDFSEVKDCSPDLVSTFAASLGQALGKALDAASLRCSIAGSNENAARRSSSRRRDLLSWRSLQQQGSDESGQLCSQQDNAITLSAELGVGTDDTQEAGGVDGSVSQMGSSIMNAFGGGSGVCIGQDNRATRIRLEQPQSTQLQREDQCEGLRRSLRVADTDILYSECTEEDIELQLISAGKGGKEDPLALSIGIGVGVGSLLLISGGITWFVWARQHNRVSCKGCMKGPGGSIPKQETPSWDAPPLTKEASLQGGSFPSGQDRTHSEHCPARTTPFAPFANLPEHPSTPLGSTDPRHTTISVWGQKQDAHGDPHWSSGGSLSTFFTNSTNNSKVGRSSSDWSHPHPFLDLHFTPPHTPLYPLPEEHICIPEPPRPYATFGDIPSSGNRLGRRTEESKSPFSNGPNMAEAWEQRVLSSMGSDQLGLDLEMGIEQSKGGNRTVSHLVEKGGHESIPFGSSNWAPAQRAQVGSRPDKKPDNLFPGRGRDSRHQSAPRPGHMLRARTAHPGMHELEGILDRTNSSGDQMLSSVQNIQVQASTSASPQCPTSRRQGISEPGPHPKSHFPRGFLPSLVRSTSSRTPTNYQGDFLYSRISKRVRTVLEMQEQYSGSAVERASLPGSLQARGNRALPRLLQRAQRDPSLKMLADTAPSGKVEGLERQGS